MNQNESKRIPVRSGGSATHNLHICARENLTLLSSDSHAPVPRLSTAFIFGDHGVVAVARQSSNQRRLRLRPSSGLRVSQRLLGQSPPHALPGSEIPPYPNLENRAGRQNFIQEPPHAQKFFQNSAHPCRATSLGRSSQLLRGELHR